MRGNETVRVVPQAVGDRLRTPGPADAEYDLEDCIVLPRSSKEEGKGYVGIGGFDIYYFGSQPEPPREAKVVVRGETHEIDGKPRDYLIRGRRRGLLISTEGMN